MLREKKVYCLKIVFALTLQWNLETNKELRYTCSIILSGYIKTKFNSPENYGKSNAHQRTKNISNYSKAAKVRAE